MRHHYEAVDVRNVRMQKLFKPYNTLSREQEVLRCVIDALAAMLEQWRPHMHNGLPHINKN